MVNLNNARILNKNYKKISLETDFLSPRKDDKSQEQSTIKSESNTFKKKQNPGQNPEQNPPIKTFAKYNPLPNQPSPTNPKKHILLYGLSANPPTGDGGHRGIVEAILQNHSEIHYIFILPVYSHPFPEKANLLDFDERINLCRLNFFYESDNGEPNVVYNSKIKICTIERTLKTWFDTLSNSEKEKMGKLIGTYDVLEYFRQQFPHFQFSFLMGQDTYNDLLLGKWKKSQEIIDYTTIYKVSREKEESKVNPAENIKINNSQMIKVNLDQIQLTDVSSTKIRQAIFRSYVLKSKLKLRLDYTFLKKSLHPSVWKYIEDKLLEKYSLLMIQNFGIEIIKLFEDELHFIQDKKYEGYIPLIRIFLYNIIHEYNKPSENISTISTIYKKSTIPSLIQKLSEEHIKKIFSFLGILENVENIENVEKVEKVPFTINKFLEKQNTEIFQKVIIFILNKINSGEISYFQPK